MPPAPGSPDSSTLMPDIVALCKRRGFVYPASEIYGGINGFWDYGPLGVQLKNNIRDWWWHHMVECPPIGPDGEPVEIVGLDSAIIQNPKTWVASGHVGGFSDPTIDCTKTNKRFRADQIYGFYLAPASGEELRQMIDEEKLGLATHHPWLLATVVASTTGEAIAEFRAQAKRKLKPWQNLNTLGRPDGDRQLCDCENIKTEEIRLLWIQPITPQEMNSIIKKLNDADPDVKGHKVVPSPYIDKKTKGVLTESRDFNLMFESYAGVTQTEENKVYLRPETAQGIFLNYKNVLDTMRVKMPFGIAQIGKSFRNEITPRNFIFRSREFEQMEMEWFCPPDESAKWFEFWKHQRMAWWRSLGVSESNLIFRDHDKDELAHYSNACVDIEYQYPFTAPGHGELEGIAHRGDYDLTQHQTHAKTKLEYFDPQTKQRYMPHVIEPASGLTRAVLVLLCEAYTPDESRPSKVYMKFLPRFAPIKAAIFPLVNKDGMPEVAQKLYQDLRSSYAVQLDVKQNIGKRYARMDEAGTPYCFTIDGQTLEDQTVTVRDRDSLSQQRISLDQVKAFLAEKMG